MTPKEIEEFLSRREAAKDFERKALAETVRAVISSELRRCRRRQRKHCAAQFAPAKAESKTGEMVAASPNAGKLKAIGVALGAVITGVVSYFSGIFGGGK